MVILNQRGTAAPKAPSATTLTLSTASVVFTVKKPSASGPDREGRRPVIIA